jgi:ADP-ribose pyrophosphatase YjhB (NUDIX family)
MTETNLKEIESLTTRLNYLIGDPKQGLPGDVFRLISQLTPMVNVDLLVKNETGQTLLTWREDEFYGPGWHVPGGIVRFKETFSSRLQAVAKTELGCTVNFNAEPLATNEVMAAHRNVRGHFISLLYQCRLLTQPAIALKYHEELPKNGYWHWHDSCPDNLIRVHEMYRTYIDSACQNNAQKANLQKNLLPNRIQET